MLLRYFYDPNLAQASYFVGCQQTGEAIVIDPARNVGPYLDLAREEGMRIEAAAETHIHADFVSGSRELAAQTGARLYLSDCGGESWIYTYVDGVEHQMLHDGDVFTVGNLRFETIHTPGHTPEHISFLLTDTVGADRPMGIFTGDFVFVGDVGRPDLLEEAVNLQGTAEAGARQMYRSLSRFRQLPDYLQVWPGHGAGSACGRDLGAVPTTTTGYEKLFNWALAPSDEDSFIELLLAGQPEPPRYFGVMKQVNKDGPALLSGLPALPEVPYEQMEPVLEGGKIVVDTRPSIQFAKGHIPGTINLPPESSFTNWAGWLLDYDQPFYLLCEESRTQELAQSLASIGLDNCTGFFNPSCITKWRNAGNSLSTYDLKRPAWVARQLERGDISLVDVRSLAEWEEEHIPGAQHIMLGYLNERAAEIPTDKPVVLQCRTGVRSSIGASFLKARGFSRVINLEGGLQEWTSAGLPTL